MTDIQTLAEAAYRVRERILQIGASAVGTHVGGSLSVADILTVLYGDVLRIRPQEPEWPQRDMFVLSKGHAAAALYAMLAEYGFIDPAECATYARSGGWLAGHPLRKLPGVEFPSGSLGHGLSLGTGLALACVVPAGHRGWWCCSVTASCRRVRSGRRSCRPRTSGWTT